MRSPEQVAEETINTEYNDEFLDRVKRNKDKEWFRLIDLEVTCMKAVKSTKAEILKELEKIVKKHEKCDEMCDIRPDALVCIDEIIIELKGEMK